jgi:hypothetical protein
MKNVIKYAAIGILFGATATQAAPNGMIAVQSGEDITAMKQSFEDQLAAEHEREAGQAILLARAQAEVVKLKDELEKAKNPPPAPPAAAPAPKQ